MLGLAALAVSVCQVVLHVPISLEWVFKIMSDADAGAISWTHPSMKGFGTKPQTLFHDSAAAAAAAEMLL